MDIVIEELENDMEDVIYGDTLIGVVSKGREPDDFAWHLTILFGDDMPEGMDDEVSLETRSHRSCRELARELGRIGRGLEIASLPEMMSNSADRVSVIEPSEYRYAVRAWYTDGAEIYVHETGHDTALLIASAIRAMIARNGESDRNGEVRRCA